MLILFFYFIQLASKAKLIIIFLILIKLKKIRQKPFLSALVANLNMRLTTVSCNLNSTEYDRDADRKEYKTLLYKFSVLVKEYWPREVSASYGTNEIRYLCNRFDLEFSTYLSLFRLYLDRDGQSIPAD